MPDTCLTWLEHLQGGEAACLGGAGLPVPERMWQEWLGRGAPLVAVTFGRKELRFFQMADSIFKSSPTGNVLGLLLKIQWVDAAELNNKERCHREF